MIEVSVILPVYNRGRIVSKSLKSLEAQTFKNFELIIIDDGSTDDTKMICGEFCSRNSNWNLFSVPHIGVSKARKLGIKKSRGKYISFIDSDDFAEPDFLKVLYENIQDVDISMCNYRILHEGVFSIKNFLFHRSGRFRNNQILKSLVSDISIKSFLWNKMFRKELFNGVFFPEISSYEDRVICIQLFFNSKNVLITGKILYNYYKNSSSITWKANESVLNDSIYTSSFIRDYLCLGQKYEEFKFNQFLFCIQMFFVLCYICISDYLDHKRNFKETIVFFVNKKRKIFDCAKTNKSLVNKKNLEDFK